MASKKSGNKTVATNESVEAYIGGVEPDWKQDDARNIGALIERVTGEAPAMWGKTIVGYGSYHYKYESGREGDSLRAGFSARKAALTIYCMGGFSEKEPLLEKLGKHKTGKSCLYIKRLSDIDMDVLEQIIRKDWDYMAEKYPV